MFLRLLLSLLGFLQGLTISCSLFFNDGLFGGILLSGGGFFGCLFFFDYLLEFFDGLLDFFNYLLDFFDGLLSGGLFDNFSRIFDSIGGSLLCFLFFFPVLLFLLLPVLLPLVLNDIRSGVENGVSRIISKSCGLIDSGVSNFGSRVDESTESVSSFGVFLTVVGADFDGRRECESGGKELHVQKLLIL